MKATEVNLTSATSRPAALTLLTTALCALALSAGQAFAATVRLGNVEATAVATVPQPATYEKRAVGELIAYLERISGKRLRQIEISDKSMPAGVIAVGTLAKKAGLVTAEELQPLTRDGYVLRVGNGRGAVCGFRDIGTIYGAYAMLEYDYPMSYGLYYEPFGSFYAVKRKLEFCAALPVEGVGYCHAPASFLDLFLYVQSKLGWNPKADVEAMIDEFMAAYYGPGARAMREYFDWMHRKIDQRRRL